MSKEIPSSTQRKADTGDRGFSLAELEDRLRYIYSRFEDGLERSSDEYREFSRFAASAPPGQRAAHVGLLMITAGVLAALIEGLVPMFTFPDSVAITLVASGSLLLGAGILAEAFIRTRIMEAAATHAEKMTADTLREVRRAREDLL